MGSEMCIRDSSCVHNKVSTNIRHNDETIVSTNHLKILGFNFSKDPNANFHVSGVINKFYTKLWSLRFLKKSGMCTNDLIMIYKTVIRPSVEYSSIIYHSLIPEYMANQLEKVQKQALKIIYGWGVDYEALVEDGTIESLKSRREAAMLKFALKVEASPRFGPSWFKEQPSTDRSVRHSTRNRYMENRYRTERDKNNPISVLTRLLNEHYRRLAE